MSSHSSSYSGSEVDPSDGGEMPELESPPESRPDPDIDEEDEEDDDDYEEDEDADADEDEDEEGDEDEGEYEPGLGHLGLGHLDPDDDLLIPPAYGNSHILPIVTDRLTAVLVADNRAITHHRQ